MNAENTMQTVQNKQGEWVVVPSEELFERTQRRFTLAYLIVSVAVVVGLYFFQFKLANDQKTQINDVAQKQCLAGITTVNKYNDLVQSIVDSRNAALLTDTESGDTVLARNDQLALKRYQQDFLPVPTKEQCAVPLLK